jgi:hypothetical protein
VAQQIEGAHLVELLAHPLQQGGFRLAAVIVLQHLPASGWACCTQAITSGG